MDPTRRRLEAAKQWFQCWQDQELLEQQEALPTSASTQRARKPTGTTLQPISNQLNIPRQALRHGKGGGIKPQTEANRRPAGRLQDRAPASRCAEESHTSHAHAIDRAQVHQQQQEQQEAPEPAVQKEDAAREPSANIEAAQAGEEEQAAQSVIAELTHVKSDWEEALDLIESLQETVLQLSSALQDETERNAVLESQLETAQKTISDYMYADMLQQVAEQDTS